KTAIYLDHGRVVANGPVEALVNRYLTDTEGSRSPRSRGPVGLSENVELLAFDFTPNPIRSGDPVKFELRLKASSRVTILELNALVYTSYASRIALMDFRPIGLPITLGAGAELCVGGTIDSVPFVEGDYSIGLYLNTGTFLEDRLDLATLTVRARP